MCLKQDRWWKVFGMSKCPVCAQKRSSPVHDFEIQWVNFNPKKHLYLSTLIPHSKLELWVASKYMWPE
ncbi:hypothetical protein HW555_005255 [Spodoptera exigua]|uniref:Uncharacterized protein n=1 Tax=Spodoptera exigua TaxID=7107 RepID=A0A835GHC8_SPOEX|nr:hypothetical protein HW555_005255 [Spodoptera exigua]